MVINHLLNGMILQVYTSKITQSYLVFGGVSLVPLNPPNQPGDVWMSRVLI